MSSETMIYTIYLLKEIVAFVVFERQTIEEFDWYSFSIIFNFSESEAFAGEALVLGEISYSLVFGMDIESFLSKLGRIFSRSNGACSCAAAFHI